MIRTKVNSFLESLVWAAYGFLYPVGEWLVIEDTATQVRAWELVEQGPRWTLTAERQLEPGHRILHPGEEVEWILLPNGTTLGVGRVEGTITTTSTQTIIITGVGTTYETTP